MLNEARDEQAETAASAAVSIGLSRSRPLWWSEHYEAAKRVIQFHAWNVEPKKDVREEGSPSVSTSR